MKFHYAECHSVGCHLPKVTTVIEFVAFFDQDLRGDVELSFVRESQRAGSGADASDVTEGAGGLVLHVRRRGRRPTSVGCRRRSPSPPAVCQPE